MFGGRLSWLTSYAQLLHPGLQGSALHPEAGGAAWSAEEPFGFFEGAQDVLALGGFHRRDAFGRGLGLPLEFGARNPQRRSGRDNYGALDQVFQLADVSGPVIAREQVEGFGRYGLDALVHAPSIFLGE